MNEKRFFFPTSFVQIFCQVEFINLLANKGGSAFLIGRLMHGRILTLPFGRKLADTMAESSRGTI